MIFLDSSYIIGLLIKSDDFHIQAHQLRPVIEYEKIIINNTVLTEVMNSLKSQNNVPNHLLNLDRIYDFLSDSIGVEYLSKEDYKAAKEIMKQFNESINFSDCTILRTMQNNNINEIVSFDSDFDKIRGLKRIYL